MGTINKRLKFFIILCFLFLWILSFILQYLYFIKEYDTKGEAIMAIVLFPLIIMGIIFFAVIFYEIYKIIIDS